MSEFSKVAVSRAARGWFCGWMPAIENDLSRFTKYSQPTIESIQKFKTDWDALNESFAVYRTLLDQGFAASTELENIANQLKRPHLMDLATKNQIEDLGKKLAEIEILMIRVATVQPAMAGITEIYRSFMKSLPGDGLIAMAQETKRVFSMIADGVSVIEELGVSLIKAVHQPGLALKSSVISSEKPKNIQRGHLRLVDTNETNA